MRSVLGVPVMTGPTLRRLGHISAMIKYSLPVLPYGSITCQRGGENAFNSHFKKKRREHVCLYGPRLDKGNEYCSKDSLSAEERFVACQGQQAGALCTY